MAKRTYRYNAGSRITLTPALESTIHTARGLVLYARASSNTPVDLRFGSALEHSIRGTWMRAGEKLSQVVIPLDSHPEWSTSSGPIQIVWPELSLGSVYIDRLEFTDRRFRGAWTFHEDGDFKGWRPNETIAAPSVQGGVLQGTVQQTSAVKPRLRSPATLSLPARAYRTVFVTMRATPQYTATGTYLVGTMRHPEYFALANSRYRRGWYDANASI